jgi:hypothetical protein
MGVMVALALCLGLAPSSNLAAEPVAELSSTGGP